MAQKYILLECNRLNAHLNYKNIDESEDKFKNKWVNNVNSYGIVIEPGDTITCESSAINTTGASDSTIEFLGSENINGYIDNKIGLELNYYINDTGQTNVKLPLINSVNQFSPLLPQEDQATVETVTKKAYLKNRSLGSIALNTFGSAERYIDPLNMPTAGLVNSYELTTPGSGYQANLIYPTTTSGNGTDMLIKVVEITNEGTTVGIPTKVQIWVQGEGYESQDTVTLAAAPISGVTTPPASATQVVKLNMVLQADLHSKVDIGPTGRRYYLPENSPLYTGPTDIVFNGIPDDPALSRTTGRLNSTWRTRSTTIQLEVPAGLNTPDNIGTILTDQLHEPEQLDPNNTYDYFDYSNYDIRSKNLRDEAQIIKPVIYKTPTYTPMATNYGNLYNVANANSYDGARATYYSNIAYDTPKRIGGLTCFNDREYALTNSVATNQFNSGLNQVVNVGDFDNQNIGNLGLFTALMMEPKSSATTPEYIELIRGDFILTNMYFIESNIRDIANGFKEAEEYYGNYNDKFIDDFTSTTYTKALGVSLDICRYADNESAAYPLSASTPARFLGQSGGGGAYPKILPTNSWRAPNQRHRYLTYYESEPLPDTTRNFALVDEGRAIEPLPGGGGNYDNDLICRGSIPFGQQRHLDGFNRNDGQELSSFVVQSRFSDNLIFDPDDIKEPFTNLFNIISEDSTTKFKVGAGPGVGQINNRVFGNGYVDTADATNTRTTTADLMAMAKRYDLAVIPVWPDGADDEFIKMGGRPYIAFVSLLECGKPGAKDYDTVINGFDQVWQIDTRNCPYGSQVGFDPSYIRNNATMVMNSNYADSDALVDAGIVNEGGTNIINQANVYNQVLMLGAVNPSVNFSPDLSRFTISGLNTPMTIGNGMPTNNQLNLIPSANPEQQCYNLNVAGQLASISQTNNGVSPVQIEGGQTYTLAPASYMNEYVPQSSNNLIDSYTGLAISKIILYNQDNTATYLNSNGVIDNNIYLSNNDPYFTYYTSDILQNTLLGKMGFTTNQLLTQFGSYTANFFNPLTFINTDQSFLEKYTKTPRPQITGAFISSAEYQPTQTNSQDMPLYANGTNIGLPSRPATTQGAITAENLPTKLDYPYLLIYSSIIAGGTDTEYYGGLDGKSKLPCVGFITRNYNQGDFFYGLEQSFNYTATKSFTLTDVETEIRLPDGSRPRLDPHNSVIYKITKPQMLPSNIAPATNISINNKNADDKRRRRERE